MFSVPANGSGSTRFPRTSRTAGSISSNTFQESDYGRKCRERTDQGAHPRPRRPDARSLRPGRCRAHLSGGAGPGLPLGRRTRDARRRGQRRRQPPCARREVGAGLSRRGRCRGRSRRDAAEGSGRRTARGALRDGADHPEDALRRQGSSRAAHGPREGRAADGRGGGEAPRRSRTGAVGLRPRRSLRLREGTLLDLVHDEGDRPLPCGREACLHRSEGQGLPQVRRGDAGEAEPQGTRDRLRRHPRSEGARFPGSGDPLHAQAPRDLQHRAGGGDALGEGHGLCAARRK